MVLRVLLASPPDRQLKGLVTELYAEWTVLAAREYLSLPTGVREAAFAVVLERLVREARRGNVTERTFALRTHQLLLPTLARHADRERRHRGAFSTRCALWLPRHPGDSRPPPENEVVDLLWRAALGDRSEPVDALLASLWHSWHGRAARVFRDMDPDRRHDAVVNALLRVVRPLTAASLTPDNLSRRLRDIAVQALSDANERDRLLRLRAMLDGPVDESVASEENVEDAVTTGFVERVSNEVMNALERVVPWMRSVFRKDTSLKDLAAQEDRTYAGLRKEHSRYRIFLRRMNELLRRVGYSRDKLPEIRSGIDRLRQEVRVSARVATAVTRAVERVLSSQLLRAILPAAAVDGLERLNARLRQLADGRRQDSGDQGGPTAGFGS